MLQSLARRITTRSIMTSELKRVPIPRKGVDYRGKIVLAPMVRSGELPSRLLALHYGADLVWGPETVDRAMIGTTRQYNPETKTIDWVKKPSQGAKIPEGVKIRDNIIFRTHAEREAGKLIFQIGTSSPEYAVQAARLVAADVVGIDVNAGCPKSFSTHDGMGAALLQTPDKLCAILEALVADIVPEFEIGISVKIRILETADKTEALVRRLVATGITGLTVHCRTTPMRPREAAIRGQLRMIANICREAGVACLANGDVANRDHALQLMSEFGTDGAMIATAAETNPSCFRPGGTLAPWTEVIEQYLAYAMEVENKMGNTKYLLGQLIPGKQPAYKLMSAAKSYARFCEAFGFEHLMERAREVDYALDIVPEGAGKSGSVAPATGSRKANTAALAAGGRNAESRAVQHASTRRSLSERGVSAHASSGESTAAAAAAAISV
ncbi:dihydrouridine synthase [Xylaria sp. CBS 124048]|nr:dihydrouridine synthase [Xylaria sp. CBS 124048]